MLTGQQVELVDVIVNKLYGVLPDPMMGKRDDDLVFVVPGIDDEERHAMLLKHVGNYLKDKAEFVSFEFEGKFR
jgi:hypothetical protein